MAPGITRTALTAHVTATKNLTQDILKVVPMPLNGIADATVVAHLLSYLTSVENSHLCGQIVFVDGGSDVVIRGDSTW